MKKDMDVCVNRDSKFSLVCKLVIAGLAATSIGLAATSGNVANAATTDATTSAATTSAPSSSTTAPATSGHEGTEIMTSSSDKDVGVPAGQTGLPNKVEYQYGLNGPKYLTDEAAQWINKEISGTVKETPAGIAQLEAEAQAWINAQEAKTAAPKKAAPVKTSLASKAPLAAPSAKRFPQTGNLISKGLSVVGIILAALTAGISYIKVTGKKIFGRLI
ncbi:hypothetical protein [Companilactobacillus mishanensis]|uniref:LPXTG cell wall anchor domain-containing protein n=1 Tax=Companilactobacillus mishanensis TaxID=2486008 RepID=A0A5P0ZK04_9LACO|nr:hypothetical protein [Companilactobacillus mishanensis]MQS53446.1 hypothetical protein [Companilactobacillus mishanensis]